jgi:hypothetical protein
LLFRSNALVEEILMRPHAGGATKRYGEMHSAQSRGAGHICQSNLLTKVLFNVPGAESGPRNLVAGLRPCRL